jgi:hypothetical protein
MMVMMGIDGDVLGISDKSVRQEQERGRPMAALDAAKALAKSLTLTPN